jgi:hypothetical protein
VTVQDLKTKLAHERIAHEETVRRMEGEARVVRHPHEVMQDEVATERASRQRAERDRDRAIASSQETKQRCAARTVQEAERNSAAPSSVRLRRGVTNTNTL